MTSKDSRPEDTAPPVDAEGSSSRRRSLRPMSVQTLNALRRRAEEIALEKEIQSHGNLEALSSEEMRQTLYQLQVHQIELEMQNEDLRFAQEQLDIIRMRYFDLYNLAPVGYCTLNEKAVILEANLTTATLLGVARGTLVKQPITRFIFKEDQDIYYRSSKQLFETGAPQAYELRMVRHDESIFWAHLESTVAQDPWTSSGQDADGATVCRVVMSDSTERKRTEEALQKALDDIRTLRGILPICASCKKIRDDQGYWSQVETYISDHTEARFSHGICPECVKKLYPELDLIDDGGVK